MKIEICRASDTNDHPPQPVSGAVWQDVKRRVGYRGFWWIEVDCLEELQARIRATGKEWVLAASPLWGDETVHMRATVYDAYME